MLGFTIMIRNEEENQFSMIWTFNRTNRSRHIWEEWDLSNYQKAIFRKLEDDNQTLLDSDRGPLGKLNKP